MWGSSLLLSLSIAGLNGPGTVAYLLIMTCRIAFKHHNHRAPDMSRLCHNRLFVDLSPVSVPMLLLVNINQREENLVKLSPWSPSPLIASQQTGSPWECWVTVHSTTVNRHCPLISGSQMFQAKLWLHWITFYSIIFLHKGRRQPQLVSSCNALSMSQIVVSCRRSQHDSHHCHPHEEHCSPLTCSYSHSQVLAELGTHLHLCLCHISCFSQGVSITWVFTSSIKSMGLGVKRPSMRS